MTLGWYVYEYLQVFSKTGELLSTKYINPSPDIKISSNGVGRPSCVFETWRLDSSFIHEGPSLLILSDCTYIVHRVQVKPHLCIVNLHKVNPEHVVFHFTSYASVNHVSETSGRSRYDTTHQRITLPYDQSKTQFRRSPSCSQSVNRLQ